MIYIQQVLYSYKITSSLLRKLQNLINNNIMLLLCSVIHEITIKFVTNFHITEVAQKLYTVIFYSD